MSDATQSPLAVQPVSEANPAGANARYEPEFEQLQSEVQKLESPAGGDVRWRDVQALGEQILSQKSKDLLVAAYYAIARLQLEGYGGLRDGLGVILGMCRTFWDSMHPEIKRMRARESALEWLIDRVNRHLESDGQAADPAALAGAADTMNEVANFVNSKLEAANPQLDGLVRALRSRAAGLTQATPAAEGAAAADATASAGPSAPAAPAGAISNRKQAFARLKEVAEYLRRTEPHSPVSYLVQRAVKWGDMPLEDVLTELVKHNDVRQHLFETLGLQEKSE